jgi:signal transduction histidine kinase
VELSIRADRYPKPVEATAYYVVAERLTNVAKYSQASKATVRIATVGDRLIVDVEDDGIGGANASAGTGLRGLADRVAALDGRLEVDSEAGRGTTVRAVIPG